MKIQRLRSSLSLAFLLLLMTGSARALNRAGDANNDKAIDMADAALVQGFLYNPGLAGTVSPLALVSGNQAEDVQDLVLIAQTATASRSGLQPDAGIIALVAPMGFTYPSESPPQPQVFDVQPGFPGGTLVDGLDSLAFEIVEGLAVESTLASPDAEVSASTAAVDLLPLNPVSPDDTITVRLTLTVHDSDGNPVDSATAEIVNTVSAGLCGDGITQAGEDCDAPGWAPAGLGMFGPTAFATGVDVVGNLAYLADTTDGLRILDISNPALPVQVGILDTAGQAWNVSVSTQYAYIADLSGGLVIADVSNPAAPLIVSTFPTFDALGVTAIGSTVYVADSTAGVRIIDAGNPLAPSELALYNTPGIARNIDMAGTLAWVADDGGLVVLDVTNPASPTLAGSVALTGGTIDVAVQGNYAYVASYSDGLQVVDISNPGAPVQVATVPTPGTSLGIAVNGVRAYLADFDGGLRVFDISTPSAPTLVGAYAPVGAGYYGVALAGSLALMASDTVGLHIADITEFCNDDCTATSCGDGKVSVGEECDGDRPNFPCSGSCTLEDCGNNIPDLAATITGAHLEWMSITCAFTSSIVVDVNGVNLFNIGMYSAPCTCAGALNSTYAPNPAGLATIVNGANTFNVRISPPDQGDYLGWAILVIHTDLGPLDIVLFDGGNYAGALARDSNICNFPADSHSVNITAPHEVNLDEPCDDGAANGMCGFCDATCSGPYSPACGDGVAECGEACDDGANNGTCGFCDTACSGPYMPSCGNSVVDCGETCDDGPLNGTCGNCDATCTGPYVPPCGSGIVECGEACDDGAANGVCGYCNATCSGPFNTCGDGVATCGEACDSGPANSDILPDACRTNCMPASCGDTVQDTGEVCDDGPGEGEGLCLDDCSAIQICGDLIYNGTEGCDDGPGEGEGLCADDCSGPQVCGDGFQNGTEVCDDGPNNGLPGMCNMDCTGYLP